MRIFGDFRVQSIVILIAVFAVSAAAFAADIPRPEHPRPDQWRDNWFNLNGEWNFKFDPDNQGAEQGWHKADYGDWPLKINVPFGWESRLSGVTERDYKGVAWYQRSFSVPDDWSGDSVWLNFAAVDWSFDAWLNGKKLAPEPGGMAEFPPRGYVPTTFNITDHLSGGDNILTVRVVDETKRTQPVGKQVGWYTRTSGIWQTVYLETTPGAAGNGIKYSVPYPDISGDVELRIVPFEKDAGLSVRVLPDMPYDAAGPSKTVPPGLEPHVEIKNDHINVTFKIDEPALWSPDEPTLYFVKLQLTKDGEIIDTVHTYFGFREITRQVYGDNDFEWIFLNGEPFYILSALNQAFDPKGIHTYPSDAHIRRDVEDALEFGFNNLRLHIKVDEPRFYYWCDRLGMTILYDFPCPWEFDADMRDNFKKVFFEALLRDFNHPSIIAWVIFNETWGIPGVKEDPEVQAYVKEMYDILKRSDPTRLVEDNSPNKRDHVVTDINSWHFYIYDHLRARDHIENEVVAGTYPGSGWNFVEGYTQGTQPLINSEYGGVSAGMGDRDISWCFHYLTQELRRHEKIGGYVYTELQDIEWEHNGFMNYDRSRKVFGYEEFVPVPDGHAPFTYNDLNTLDFLVIDAIAGQQVEAFADVSVPTALSYFSGKDGGRFKLNWRVWSQSRIDLDWFSDHAGHGSFAAEKYAVSEGPDIVFKTEPDRLYLVYAWVENEAGDMVARNFWCFNTLSDDYTGSERHVQLMAGGDNKYIQAPILYSRWTPNDYEAVEGDIETYPENNRESLSIPGDASVTYHVPLPEGADLSKVKKAKLQLELAACAGDQRVCFMEREGWFDQPNWRGRENLVHTPQTDVDNKYPSTLEIVVNGRVVSEVELPNDPADYRGILSNSFESAPPSSYGYLQRIYVPVSALTDGENEITIRTKEGSDTGFRLFGAKSGRHPSPPSLILYESGQ